MKKDLILWYLDEEIKKDDIKEEKFFCIAFSIALLAGILVFILNFWGG